MEYSQWDDTKFDTNISSKCEEEDFTQATQATQVRTEDLETDNEISKFTEDPECIGYLRGVIAGKMEHIFIYKGKDHWFGRSKSCDTRLPDTPGGFVSSKHFLIQSVVKEESSYNAVILIDHSRNGTLVGGIKISKGEPYYLHNASCIDLDEHTQFVFFYSNGDPGKEYMNHKGYIVTSQYIGKGTFAKVQFGLDLKSNRQCAVKIITKARIGWNDKDKKREAGLLNEIRIMKSLHQPNILSVYDVIDGPRTLCIFLPYIPGGDLHSYIVEQPERCVSEKRASFIFFQIVRAIEYLHSRGVTHRDVKPENILLDSKGNYPRVYVSDFGLATAMGAQAMASLCGTFQYLAPEVLKSNGMIESQRFEDEGKGYTNKVDCWSVGVLLYALLSGTLPFSSSVKDEDDDQNLFKQIISGRLYFRDGCWTNVSPSAKSIIQKLIVVDPQQRFSMREALTHPFLKKYFNTILEHYSKFDNTFLGLTYDKLTTMFYPKIPMDINLRKRPISISPVAVNKRRE